MPIMLDREGLCTRCIIKVGFSTFLSMLGEIQGWVKFCQRTLSFGVLNEEGDTLPQCPPQNTHGKETLGFLVTQAI